MLSRTNKLPNVLESALDGLSAHIAVLDESGTIVLVNRAWTRFARANGASPHSDGVGTNYLAVCEAAEASPEDAPHAIAIGRAIRRVIAREISEFEIEYPCHSPTAQRWFLARVVDAKSEPRMILVIHENITARKLVEAAAEERHVSESVVKRVLQAFGREWAGHSEKRKLGRAIAADSGLNTLVGFVNGFATLGMGTIQLATAVSARYMFRGRDLVEQDLTSPSPTCAVTLGYLEGAVAAVTGEPTLGVEIACQSQGHPECLFIVQTRPA